MIRFIFILFTIFLSTSITYAIGLDTSSNFDCGLIYSGSSFPVDVAKNVDDSMPAFEGLKSGEATTNNILGIVELGDRGIQAAAKNGGIARIYYVDTKVNKVYIPLGFIPIYVKQTKTIVYGE